MNNRYDQKNIYKVEGFLKYISIFALILLFLGLAYSIYIQNFINAFALVIIQLILIFGLVAKTIITDDAITIDYKFFKTTLRFSDIQDAAIIKDMVILKSKDNKRKLFFKHDKIGKKIIEFLRLKNFNIDDPQNEFAKLIHRQRRLDKILSIILVMILAAVTFVFWYLNQKPDF